MTVQVIYSMATLLSKSGPHARFFLINKRIMAKRLTDYRERAKITLIIRIIKYKSLRIYISQY